MPFSNFFHLSHSHTASNPLPPPRTPCSHPPASVYLYLYLLAACCCCCFSCCCSFFLLHLSVHRARSLTAKHSLWYVVGPAPYSPLAGTAPLPFLLPYATLCVCVLPVFNVIPGSWDAKYVAPFAQKFRN